MVCGKNYADSVSSVQTVWLLGLINPIVIVLDFTAPYCSPADPTASSSVYSKI